jgi:hypothetical protein
MSDFRDWLSKAEGDFGYQDLTKEETAHQAE